MSNLKQQLRDLKRKVFDEVLEGRQASDEDLALLDRLAEETGIAEELGDDYKGLSASTAVKDPSKTPSTRGGIGMSPFATKSFPFPSRSGKEVLAHIGGASGSGKSTLAAKLKEKYPSLTVKDLDDLDDAAVAMLGWQDKPKSDYSDSELRLLADRRQSLLDSFLNESDPPIVLVGHHWEGENTLNIPTKSKFYLDVTPQDAAFRAYIRSQDEDEKTRRSLVEMPEDIEEAEKDLARLQEEGYLSKSEEEIIDWVAGQLKPLGREHVSSNFKVGASPFAKKSKALPPNPTPKQVQDRGHYNDDNVFIPWGTPYEDEPGKWRITDLDFPHTNHPTTAPNANQEVVGTGDLAPSPFIDAPVKPSNYLAAAKKQFDPAVLPLIEESKNGELSSLPILRDALLDSDCPSLAKLIESGKGSRVVDAFALRHPASLIDPSAIEEFVERSDEEEQIHFMRNSTRAFHETLRNENSPVILQYLRKLSEAEELGNIEQMAAAAGKLYATNLARNPPSVKKTAYRIEKLGAAWDVLKALQTQHEQKHQKSLSLSDIPPEKLEHKYGCLLAIIPMGPSNEIVNWAKGLVWQEHLGPGGFAQEPHVTIAYGFEDLTPLEIQALKDLVAAQGEIALTLGKLALFTDNPDGDVLHIEVESEALTRLNREIAEKFPTPGNKQDSYKPHLTLCYLQPEHSKQYTEYTGPLFGEKIVVNTAKWSGPDKKEELISLHASQTSLEDEIGGTSISTPFPKDQVSLPDVAEEKTLLPKTPVQFRESLLTRKALSALSETSGGALVAPARQEAPSAPQSGPSKKRPESRKENQIVPSERLARLRRNKTVGPSPFAKTKALPPKQVVSGGHYNDDNIFIPWGTEYEDEPGKWRITDLDFPHRNHPTENPNKPAEKPKNGGKNPENVQENSPQKPESSQVGGTPSTGGIPPSPFGEGVPTRDSSVKNTRKRFSSDVMTLAKEAKSDEGLVPVLYDALLDDGCDHLAGLIVQGGSHTKRVIDALNYPDDKNVGVPELNWDALGEWYTRSDDKTRDYYWGACRAELKYNVRRYGDELAHGGNLDAAEQWRNRTEDFTEQEGRLDSIDALNNLEKIVHDFEDTYAVTPRTLHAAIWLNRFRTVQGIEAETTRTYPYKKLPLHYTKSFIGLSPFRRIKSIEDWTQTKAQSRRTQGGHYDESGNFVRDGYPFVSQPSGECRVIQPTSHNNVPSDGCSTPQGGIGELVLPKDIKILLAGHRHYLTALFGDIDPNLLGAMCNAQDGAILKVIADEFMDGRVEINVSGNGYNATRSFKKRNGKLVVDNEAFKIPDMLRDGSPNPLKSKGYEIFANQVRALKKAGVSRIRTEASGNRMQSQQKDGFNGYYTWPRLGYSGRVGHAMVNQMPDDLREQMGDSDEIRDLFDLPGGKEWWLENGRTLPCTFDLTDGSRNMKALEAYLSERRQRNG